jgi:hypothetical protein
MYTLRVSVGGPGGGGAGGGAGGGGVGAGGIGGAGVGAGGGGVGVGIGGGGVGVGAAAELGESPPPHATSAPPAATEIERVKKSVARFMVQPVLLRRPQPVYSAALKRSLPRPD